MIVSLLIGRKGSKGFPGKNMALVNGRSMAEYPLRVSAGCDLVNRVFVSTDDERLKSLACYSYGVEIIDRPLELAIDEALCDDVFVHGYKEIEKRIGEGKIEFICLFFANAVGITRGMLNEMIEELRKYPDADSICTISHYPMFSPYRMRFMARNFPERLESFLELDELKRVTCNRNSGVKAYIYDCSCTVVRPRCLENIKGGMPPQRWLGTNILPYMKNRDIPALDIDYEWQVPQMELWLKKYWKE